MAARDILDVLLRFRADTRQATQSVEDTTKAVDKLNDSFKSLGAGLAGALTGAAAKNALDFMSELASAADRIGLTTDALQELRFVGQQAGIQVEELDDVMQSFVERLGDAQGQTGEAYEALQALNVELANNRGGFKDTETVLYEVADAFANMDDAQQRVFRSQQLFESDVGVKFLNVLTQGSEAMREMRARARELGVVMDEEMIRKSQEASRQIGTLAFILRGQFNRAIAEVAPAVTTLGAGFEFLAVNVSRAAGRIKDYVAGVKEQEKATEDVADATFKVSDAIKDMNADIQASMAQTRQALSGDVPREIETLADAAAIRLEAARAVNNRDFATAAQRLKEYNEALLILRDSGRESTSILRGMFLQGESLARTLETVSQTPTPRTIFEATPLGQPNAPLIPITPPSFAPSLEGVAGPGAGRPGRIVTRPGRGNVPGAGAFGTTQQFEEFVGPLDPRTLADRLLGSERLTAERFPETEKFRRERARRNEEARVAERERFREETMQSSATVPAPVEAIVTGIRAGFAGVMNMFRQDATYSERPNDIITDSLAQAERQHGPVN